MLLKKSDKELFLVLSHCFSFSGPLEPGALTVDLEAAERALDQLLAIPWIKESVTLYFLLCHLDCLVPFGVIGRVLPRVSCRLIPGPYVSNCGFGT